MFPILTEPILPISLRLDGSVPCASKSKMVTYWPIRELAPISILFAAQINILLFVATLSPIYISEFSKRG